MSEQAPAERPAPLRPAPAVPMTPPGKTTPTLLRGRFLIGYAVLAIVLGGAVGALVLMVSSGEERSTSAPWSDFAPEFTGTLGVREIARAVSERYTLPSGAQLVGVLGGPMLVPQEQQNVPVSAIVLSSGRAGVPNERIYVNYPEAGAFYQMCGSGQNCNIPGAASQARGALLSREALELALHTFRRMPADFVVVFPPPALGVAMFWRRQDLQPLLDQPLSATLRSFNRPVTPGDVSPAELRILERYVEPSTFAYEFRGAADQSALLFLAPR